jgi:hypothetical protein
LWPGSRWQTLCLLLSIPECNSRDMDVDLRAFTVAGLLRLYSEIVEELVRRKACRSTNNPVADIAEMLVIKALRLMPAAKSTKGYDAIDGAGKRYEVKARRMTRRNPSRMLSAIRDCEARHFDFLAFCFVKIFRSTKLASYPLRSSSNAQLTGIMSTRICSTSRVSDKRAMN